MSHALTGLPRPTVIGHRTAMGHAPENTLAGIAVCHRLGAHAVELDVQCSADGHAVLLHDATVDRTTDGSGPVAAMTLARLRRLDAGGEPPPRLEEALEAARGLVTIVELKAGSGPGVVDATARAIRACGAMDGVIIGSFSTPLLRQVRAALPGVPTGLGEDELRRLYLAWRLRVWRVTRVAGDVVHAPEHAGDRRVVTQRLVAAAHRRGLPVQVWTVNEPEAMHRLLDMGVDGLMTDYPDRLHEVVAARAGAQA